MKKASLCLLLTFVFLLVSCNSESIENTPKNEHDFEKIFQKNFHNGNYGSNIACENEEGYFFINGSFLYYMEKENLETTLVCNRLECRHNNNACDAFLETNEIAYYNERLFYLESGKRHTIFSMNLDGSNRREVLSYNTELSYPSYALNQGYLYFIENLNLCCVSLENVDKKTKLYEFTESSEAGFFFLWADADKVYVCTENKNYAQVFYEYDLLEGKSKQIWAADGMEEEWDSKGVAASGWYLDKRILYLYLNGSGIWKYDITKETYTRIAEIADKKQYGYATFDAEYIYINAADNALNSQKASEYSLYVYNYQGELVDVISLDVVNAKRKLSDLSIIGSTSDKVFCTGFFSEEFEDFSADSVQDIERMSLFYAPIPNQGKGLIEVEL
ncbi:MAG: hypothetical protein LBB42_05555 [Coriobacteriales bacterium]|jgi:hypothetical protein|nr:hypothetical protein [Coriobacteriales bacterium]